MRTRVSRTGDDATRQRTRAWPLTQRTVFAPCLAAIASLFATAAAGQALPCPDIENDAERLACYDRALRPNRPPEAPAAQAPPAAVPTAAPAPAAAAPTGTAVAPAPAAAIPAGATPPPATVALPAAAPADTDTKDEIVVIVVSEVTTGQGRPTIFRTADGKAWVQNDSQAIRNLPPTPFEAELKPGALGSLFLLPKGQSRAIRVRLPR